MLWQEPTIRWSTSNSTTSDWASLQLQIFGKHAKLKSFFMAEVSNRLASAANAWSELSILHVWDDDCNSRGIYCTASLSHSAMDFMYSWHWAAIWCIQIYGLERFYLEHKHALQMANRLCFHSENPTFTISKMWFMLHVWLPRFGTRCAINGLRGYSSPTWHRLLNSNACTKYY